MFHSVLFAPSDQNIINKIFHLMTDLFSKIGMEQFSEKVADKVIERGADKFAERVVDRITPIITSNTAANAQSSQDKIITRKQAADLLHVSEPTLRNMYTKGPLKECVYGLGTRNIRFRKSELMAALGKF